MKKIKNIGSTVGILIMGVFILIIGNFINLHNPNPNDRTRNKR